MTINLQYVTFYCEGINFNPKQIEIRQQWYVRAWHVISVENVTSLKMESVHADTYTD
jgi:hypothetical protein